MTTAELGAAFARGEVGRASRCEVQAWPVRGYVAYVLFSYATPIAVRTDEHAYFTTGRFSVSTVRHRNAALAACDGVVPVLEVDDDGLKALLRMVGVSDSLWGRL